MDSQQTGQGLAQKSDHELLVMLVVELAKIRQLLEGRQLYDIDIDESRSGAWGAKYSGTITAWAKTLVELQPPQPLAPSQYEHLEPGLSNNIKRLLKENRYADAVHYFVDQTGASPKQAGDTVQAIWKTL